MTEFNDFAGIAIVGAGLSLVIEYVKNKWGTDSFGSKSITLLLSIVIGAVYIWIRSTPIFPTIITVLGTASIVYGFFFKK